MSERRYRSGGERRDDIVRAAYALIGERGYRATTLDAVAARAGLTKPGLLHHFPSKEDLLIAVLEARDEWDMAAAAADRGPSLRTLELLTEYNAARPGIVQTYTVLAGESVTEDHPAREWFTTRYETVRKSLTLLLEKEFATTPLPPGLTPDRAATLLIAVMDGTQIQWLLSPDRVSLTDAVRDFLALLRGGGAAREADPPPHD